MLSQAVKRRTIEIGSATVLGLFGWWLFFYGSHFRSPAALVSLSLVWCAAFAAFAFLAARATAHWRRAAESAACALRWHQEVVGHLPDLLIVIDQAGRIVMVNPAVERLMEAPQENLLGADWLERYVPELERPDLQQTIEQMLDRRDETSVTNQIITPRGNRDVQWHNRTMRDAAGRAEGIVSIGRDVTDLKLAHRHAVQSQRLAAIGQMVAGLAHESGNALQRSQACLDMLAMQLKGQPEALDLVYRVQIAQDRLQHLYEELQHYAAPVVLQRETLSLRAMVAAAWQHLEPMWQGRDVVLRCEPQDETPAGAFDRHAMEGVFRNILQNSLQACSDPVRIEVRCQTAQTEGREVMRISIADNGPGLSHESKQRIFHPFYSTKTQGTGLGMSIARRNVEAHGGQIAVGAGAALGGAEIVIDLPKA